jgi:putative ABC transport system substrate-binding protein
MDGRTTPQFFRSRQRRAARRGNITGFAELEASLGGKWLELLSEIAPGLKRAAVVFNPDASPPLTYMLPSFETAARSLKVVLTTAPVHSDVEMKRPSSPLGTSRETALSSCRVYG